MAITMNRSAAALLASALCCVLVVGGCEKKPAAGKVDGKSTTDKTVDAVKDAKDKVVEGAKEAKDTVVEGAKEVKDKAVELADKGKIAVADAAAAAKEKIVAAAETGYKDTATQLEDFRKNVSDIHDPTKKTLFQKALENIEAEYKSLGDQLTKLRDSAPADAAAANAEFTSMLGKIRDGIKSASEKIIGK